MMNSGETSRENHGNKATRHCRATPRHRHLLSCSTFGLSSTDYHAHIVDSVREVVWRRGIDGVSSAVEQSQAVARRHDGADWVYRSRHGLKCVVCLRGVKSDAHIRALLLKSL